MFHDPEHRGVVRHVGGKLAARNSFVRRLGREEAEQVALIALARAARSYRHRKRGPGGFAGYAYRVVARAVLSAAMSFFGRDSKRSGQCPVEELDPPGREREPADVVVRAEEVAAVERVLGQKVEGAVAPQDARGGNSVHNRLVSLLRRLDARAKVFALKTPALFAKAGEVIRSRLVAG
jgi:hypothetical protein